MKDFVPAALPRILCGTAAILCVRQGSRQTRENRGGERAPAPASLFQKGGDSGEE